MGLQLAFKLQKGGLTHKMIFQESKIEAEKCDSRAVQPESQANKYSTRRKWHWTTRKRKREGDIPLSPSPEQCYSNKQTSYQNSRTITIKKSFLGILQWYRYSDTCSENQNLEETHDCDDDDLARKEKERTENLYAISPLPDKNKKSTGSILSDIQYCTV